MDRKSIRYFGAEIVAAPADESFPHWLERTAPRLVYFADQFALRRAVFRRAVRALWREPDVLVVASTKAAQRRVRAATGATVPIFSTFQSVVRLFDLLEPKRGSVYLLGPTADQLFVVEQNVRATFPAVHVVGRSVVHERIADNTLTAIVKAAPTVVLVGPLDRNGRRWVLNRFREFGTSLVLYAPEAFRRMAHRGRSTVGTRLFGMLLWPVLVGALGVHRLVVRYRARRAVRPAAE